jgi:hypothetical protein
MLLHSKGRAAENGRIVKEYGNMQIWAKLKELYNG